MKFRMIYHIDEPILSTHGLMNFPDLTREVEWRNEDRLTDYCGQQIKGKYIHCPQAIPALGPLGESSELAELG